jgi:hypothetical protein
MEQKIIVPDEVKQALSVAGWDLDKELDEMIVESSRLELPRVRIEHKSNGKHRMYIDVGESYLEPNSQEVAVPGNKLTAVVFAEQFIRALWKEGEEVPACSAIDDIPVGDETLSDSCKSCEHGAIGGECKPKVRLLLLTDIGGEIKPLVINLSPTSIKHWQTHKKKLQRSNLPVVAMNTTFSLNDVKKNGYRWAEVIIDVNGIASKELLSFAKQARIDLQRIMFNIDDQDFSDPGDRLS